MASDAKTMNISQEVKIAFKTTFDVDWEEVIHKVLNLSELLALKPGIQGVEDKWRAGPCVKLAPGLYVAQVEDVYVFNGFYQTMRVEFLGNSLVKYFVVEFKGSWKEFRTNIIGGTNPSQANPESIRGKAFKTWKELNIKKEPSYGMNVVHASAGPVEGVRERMIWLGNSLEEDVFGAQLLGILSRDKVEALLDNKHVVYGENEGLAFDIFEEKDSAYVLEQLLL